MPRIALCAALVSAFLWRAHAADETSSGDKLRTLYSNHFTFTDDGFPLVTIEVMGGQRSAHLSAAGGLVVRPDGEGGSAIRAASRWRLSVEGGRKAVVEEWSVLERFSMEELQQAEAARKRFEQQGHRARLFESGTVFAVDGEVLDTRELLVALDPVPEGRGRSRAKSLEKRYSRPATVYSELVRRPSGTIVAEGSGITVRNPSVIWFYPRKGPIEVEDVPTGRGGSQRSSRREDRRYFGAIYATVGRDGKLTVANAVGADSLLAGLVPSEMFTSAPLEALKAQAVAARTELLQKIGTRHLADPFLLCASQHCQVYSGAGHEHPRTTRAVRETRGQVLVRADDSLVDARYSASCGGHGEHNEVVWGGTPDPTLRGHLDGPLSNRYRTIDESNVHSFLRSDRGRAHCAGTRYSKGRYRWKASISARELTRRIAGHLPRVGRVRGLRALARGVSGRITKLRVRGTRGAGTLDGELRIRRALGGLRSSLFVTRSVGAESAPDAFEFRGAGFGHGVGMCQVGAIGMADQSRTLREILTHYYRNSKLRKLY